MKIIKSFEEIMLGIKSVRDFKEKYYTNFFPNKDQIELWIEKASLYKIDKFNGVVFFIRKNESFNSLYFVAKSEESLSNGISLAANFFEETCTVIDLIGKGTELSRLNDIFKNYKFVEYTSLTRMSRVINEDEDFKNDISIDFANTNDVQEIKILLDTYFDPLSEQIPFKEEILNWIKKNHILVKREDNLIVGFVIFDLIGMTSYLRYWFVHPEYRDKKIGSALLNKYFFLSSGCKKQMFWVINDNENAIKRYKHYGFEMESLNDIILKKDRN
ncbi:GNAT family N-acetyltransferase [Marinifilum flexuosum]|uniref:GNAT family N-acetyltransferase n=1 Tax=Marinifilum flexuosum TaxID=1117708 RepID=UPI002493E589|nr:GNAT family N-acetyltransferase [Marinifilum flexuosum]